MKMNNTFIKEKSEYRYINKELIIYDEKSALDIFHESPN
jgi:hypothetical protein